MLLMNPAAAEVRKAGAPCRAASRILPADRAWRQVLSIAGALPRDAVDQRVVAETIARKGKIRAAPGQLPVIAPAAPYPDADADGMDDRWEARHGADPKRSDPWADSNRNGWANLEEFLQSRHRERVRAAEAALSPDALRAALKGQRLQD